MRKQLLIIALALTTDFIYGQIVNIPDANFKAKLLDYAPTIDSNNDMEIQVYEAMVVKKLYLSKKNIANLTGIEAFTALTELNCSDNQLSTLDVSKNTALIWLNCPNNQISTLNISKNTALEFLSCPNNQLSTLDVSNNFALIDLYCYGNHLSTLDVSKNTALIKMNCYNNQLTTLDVSKNFALTSLSCHTNQLSTICVNTTQNTQNTTNWQKDDTAQYSTECNTITGLEDTYSPTSKKLHRIITPLGQEIKPEQAIEGVFIYQYTDGSTRKIMKLE